MDIVLFVLGLIMLVGGAELLVRGASRLSLSLGISPLVVGLTVVACGTSAPELAVSVQSAMTDRADIALGNVVGSNIMNILLILGASAVIVPLVVASQLIRQEVPVMIGFALLFWGLAADGVVARHDGLLLVGLLALYLALIVRQSRRQNRVTADVCPAAFGDRKAWDDHWAIQIGLVVAGLGLLALGADWLVEAAVAFARHLGMSELLIGLTIVAIGTSFPEIATSLMAAVRGQRDIAVGNVVGSNIFNVAGVLGVSGLLAPSGIPVHASALSFDLPVMIAVSLACLPIFFTGSRIARWEGGLFLGLYGVYLTYLILAARQHEALTTYGWVLAVFVLPIVALTLLVICWREWRLITSTRQRRRRR